MPRRISLCRSRTAHENSYVLFDLEGGDTFLTFPERKEKKEEETKPRNPSIVNDRVLFAEKPHRLTQSVKKSLLSFE